MPERHAGAPSLRIHVRVSPSPASSRRLALRDHLRLATRHLHEALDRAVMPPGMAWASTLRPFPARHALRVARPSRRSRQAPGRLADTTRPAPRASASTCAPSATTPTSRRSTSPDLDDLRGRARRRLVVEGSMLGGQHVAATVERDLGLGDDAMAYLRPPGSRSARAGRRSSRHWTRSARGPPPPSGAPPRRGQRHVRRLRRRLPPRGPDLMDRRPRRSISPTAIASRSTSRARSSRTACCCACRGRVHDRPGQRQQRRRPRHAPAGLLGRPIARAAAGESWQRLAAAGEAGLPRR